ncbi:nucleotide sugar dehydrogenase [Saccharibacillus kuerlensis]|uniref:UDP-N-acetyl-D-galactosamine dehydrogenase n=1 Tax=Saccharibacillus kuerlensis TaxID=459527 RepID=A0ABQ2L699_9BACL|nr:nucleotide sugar dehydrogenase [Saccharibacillus kuerlensis]GGO04896.1 UDP-N-acetyl-D-galactosamine dehydrogenase [Saccharibacillus kuerlensis]
MALDINYELATEPELYRAIVTGQEKIAVVGLGYVGLPLAVAFSRVAGVIGFDLNESRIEKYRSGEDVTGDIGDEVIRDCSIDFTSDSASLAGVRCFVVAVPTPVKSGNVPDLRFVRSASRTVGEQLTKGSVVVYESTVYPGVTEEVCIPILEEVSGLRCGIDFKVGYSPERINPGDKVHRLENIVKIVSGSDDEALDLVAKLYEMVIEAGVHRASSIKVAEAAKVIENAQRDINIAFMNELSMLFNQMGIDTNAVLRAAETKWNFLKFRPGLVGGHCIGIDPYYLTYKAEDTGYRSKIILAGRHINDGMGKYVAQSIIKTAVQKKLDLRSAKIAVLGLAFKENCNDIRNSKVIDIIRELQDYGVQLMVVDPLVESKDALQEYGIELHALEDLSDLDMAIVAVAHEEFVSLGHYGMADMFSPDRSRFLFDIKGIFDRASFEQNGYHYWSL